MWKISVGGGRKHGRKTSTDSVASRGYLSGSEGKISAARGRRSANLPPCPMAATEWMGHGTGSWDSGGPLSHGATVGRLVPTLWGAEVWARHGGGQGQPAWLTPEQEGVVAEEAAKGTFTTAADVRRWVADQFGVTYRPKVPRAIHVKADPQVQEAWKKGAAA